MVPDNVDVATDKRPTLRWNQVPGADRYEIEWTERPGIRPRSRLKGTEYHVDRDLLPNIDCKWRVRALGTDGPVLALGTAEFLSFGTKPIAKPERTAIAFGTPLGMTNLLLSSPRYSSNWNCPRSMISAWLLSTRMPDRSSVTGEPFGR